MEILSDIIKVTAISLYAIGTGFLLLYVGAYSILLGLYVRHRHNKPTPPPTIADTDLPSVAVQLPIYNEAHVAERLIRACAALDYPHDKLFIQVLDDSTDDTAAIIAELVQKLQQSGLHIMHHRRTHREGYKAGALAYGLRHTQADCIAIFDADFLPPPDFLRRTAPYFHADDRLALVQTRWSHFNHDTNWLTRAQALNIDAHFVVEQTARNRGNLPMSMNGTGALWRVAAVRDAGGWSAVTLTEDLDLSYRAQLRGWRFCYLPDVAVPGELPPQVQAYKTQQARWATGSTQCLRLHAPKLIAHRGFSPLQKFMGVMHLAQYAIQPVLLGLFLLSPPLLLGGFFQQLPNLGLLSLVGLVPPLLIVCGQAALYEDWWRRLAYFPAQFMVGVAVVLSNSIAVLKAFRHNPQHGQHAEFKRTPKFRLSASSSAWAHSHYRLTIDRTTYGEGALALYAAFGLVSAIGHMPALVPYMFIYTCSFGFFALWNIYQVGR